MTLTGEGVKTCGCDLMCSNASWDMTEKVRPWHKYDKTYIWCTHIFCTGLTNKCKLNQINQIMDWSRFVSSISVSFKLQNIYDVPTRQIYENVGIHDRRKTLAVKKPQNRECSLIFNKLLILFGVEHDWHSQFWQAMAHIFPSLFHQTHAIGFSSTSSSVTCVASISHLQLH